MRKTDRKCLPHMKNAAYDMRRICVAHTKRTELISTTGYIYIYIYIEYRIRATAAPRPRTAPARAAQITLPCTEADACGCGQTPRPFSNYEKLCGMRAGLDDGSEGAR